MLENKIDKLSKSIDLLNKNFKTYFVGHDNKVDVIELDSLKNSILKCANKCVQQGIAQKIISDLICKHTNTVSELKNIDVANTVLSELESLLLKAG